MPDDEYEKVRAWASVQNRTASSFMRHAVIQYIKALEDEAS
jgi:predicted DNA-binding protein